MHDGIATQFRVTAIAAQAAAMFMEVIHMSAIPVGGVTPAMVVVVITPS